MLVISDNWPLSKVIRYQMAQSVCKLNTVHTEKAFIMLLECYCSRGEYTGVVTN